VSAIPVLSLSHSGRTIVMDLDTPAICLGRDAGNQIVIAHRTASRLHGRIERRRDKYFYTDLSTNGTYVAMEGIDEMLLRREEVMLRGRGCLAYGFPAKDARAELVLFSVE
jgi:pSer/pThr/pTyr-binding forkhead associated (FHA) protein